MHPSPLGRRRPSQVPARSYVILAMALLAALLAAFGLAGGFPGSQADAAVTGQVITDRGAESPVYVMNGSEIRTRLAQVALTARMTAAAHAAAVLAAHTYTVRPGDSISSVALRKCHGQGRYWTGIYAASRAHRWTGVNANVLAAGQHLYLSCAYVPSVLRFAPVPPPPSAPAATVAAGSTAGRGYSAPAAATYHGSGSMQQCIISRESGGNSGVWNASGHWGLYQFSAQTWAAHGGNPASFGSASVAQQNAVYYATVAADGYSDWTPYDGC